MAFKLASRVAGPMRGGPALALVLSALLVAGCVSTEPTPAADASTAATEGETLSFLPPVRVDGDRIASEPSVKVGGDGTIYVAAPTGVIKYATRPQDALQHADKGIFQGAIWRSQDGGASFDFRAGIGPAPVPYRTPWLGGGDSTIAIDSAGIVYVSDQFGLFTESVVSSQDNGTTWASGSPAANGPRNTDRQWLAAHPTEPGILWMNFNSLEGVHVAKSSDGGRTFAPQVATDVVAPPGPLLAVPGLVAFAVRSGGDLFFVHSEDEGATWATEAIVEDAESVTDFFPGLVADKAGALYVTWIEEAPGGSALAYARSDDLGQTWSKKSIVATEKGRALFAWSVAGEAGRLGFSWYATEDPDGADTPWFAKAAIVTGADTDAPSISLATISEEPIRVGPPCENGSTCTSGRELGDFQSCAVGPDGRLVVVYVTVLSAEEGGRITFVKQAEGPKLLDAPLAPWVV